jgi:hypothetical protein
MESLIFLTEKKNGRIKALTESHLIAAVIDFKQGQDIMTANIPNPFMQTDIKKKLNGKNTIMKMQGQLVNMLVNISPEDYQDFVCMEGNHKVLYAKMLKALHGMLQSSPLYYKKFCKDIEEVLFKIN